MTYRQLPLVVGALALGLVAGPATPAQDQPDPDKQEQQPGMDSLDQMTAEQRAAMAEYLASMQPGEPHEHLDYFVGTWDTKTKIFMGGPGSQAMESAGVSVQKWVLDGRYLMDEFKGSLMGQPYEGIGLTGYDNYKNMYVASWANSMDTQYLTMKGVRNPETGVFTFYGEMDEPMLKVYGRMVKYVTRIVDEDHYIFEIYDLHAASDYRVVEITYTRRKPD